MGVNVIACIALLIWFITDIGNAYYTQFAGGYYGNYAGLFIIIDGGLGVIGSFVGILAFIIAIRGAPQLRRSGVCSPLRPIRPSWAFLLSNRLLEIPGPRLSLLASAVCKVRD